MKLKYLPLLLILVLLFVPSTGRAAEFIKIASFNIAEFGEGDHLRTRDLDYIAKMLVGANLDLIAIQEVGLKGQAEEQLTRLLEKINEKVPSGQPRYFSYVTPVSGDERYAVIYRSPVVLEDGLRWLDEDKNPAKPRLGGKIYHRIPVAIPFRAGNFDFVVVTVHLSWGNLDRRTAEVRALGRFLRQEDSSEDDWIVLGNMNRYGKYGKNAPRKAFDQLLVLNFESRYRFPLLEAITDPDDMKIFRAAKDEHSTTIAQSENIYDQFIITEGAFPEFGTSDPRLEEDVGIIAFDREPRWNPITDHNGVKYRVSDHRPIWIRLRIDLTDDD